MCTIPYTFNNKNELLTYLFKYLQDLSYFKHFLAFLVTLRILSRDKKDLENLFTADRIETLLQFARLVGKDSFLRAENLNENESKVVIEAQKCISNLIFNNNVIRKLCCHNGCIDGIMLRLRMYKNPGLPIEVKYFDMRILFLITALNSEMVAKIRDEYHGIVYLIEELDLLLKESQECESTEKDHGVCVKDDNQMETVCLLSDQIVDACCEVLKVLFNLTVDLDQLNLNEVCLHY